VDPTRWSRVQSIFDAASELEPGARPAFLDRECGEDAELRGEVESFLATLGGQTDYIGDSVRDTLQSALERIQGFEAGSRVGPYRLIRKIGQGGMASVYLADRADREFERQVAIKFTRPEVSAAEMSRRFRVERQILANLDHPNIARMLDGGLSDSGIPYLVMEYVDGVPIDEYCRGRQLSVREIVELFRAVCSAVEYAHHRLVIHRDIKPSNILVTQDGVPKLLDFGIAKLLTPSADTAALTRPTQRLMTVEYASPEQILGDPVTTATDVYALGLVLYELITLSRPFDAGTTSPLELQKKICTTDPPRPSKVVADRALARALDGDLDHIILMAVRKEPKERYGSVERFSEDLNAWLDGFPVSARRGTTRYRAVKFARRHRVGIAVVALFLVLLAAFSVGMGVLALRLARERNTARQERERATQVSAFLSNLFQGADPYRAKGAELTARELLDEGSKRIETNLAGQPVARAAVLNTMAAAYQHLGDLDDAQRLYAAEAEAYRQADGERSIGRADSIRKLADVMRQRGDLPAAETHLREALAIQQAMLGPTDKQLSHSWNNLGLVVQARGRAAEARDLFRRAVEISQKYPSERLETLTMMSNLGAALADTGDWDEAEKVLRDVLERRRELLGDRHPQAPRSMNRLGHLLLVKGSYPQAEHLLRDALAVYSRILPIDFPDRLVVLNNLAHVLQNEHQFSEAERLYREAITIGEAKLGEHADVALWRSNLASLLVDKGDLGGAKRLYPASLALCRKKLGPGSTREAQILVGMGQMYIRSGDYTEAERDLEQALAIRRQDLGAEHPDTADALYQLALLRRAQGRGSDAEQLAREAVATDAKRVGGIAASNHLLGLAQILVDRHDPAAAEPLAQKAVDLRAAILPADAWQVKEAQDQLSGIRAAR